MLSLYVCCVSVWSFNKERELNKKKKGIYFI